MVVSQGMRELLEILDSQLGLDTHMTSLQDRADPPGNEFLVAEALARGALARCNAQQHIEYLAANFGDCGVAVGDAAAVDVHVVAHAAERGAVARNLDDRDGWKSDRTAAAGCKRNQIH